MPCTPSAPAPAAPLPHASSAAVRIGAAQAAANEALRTLPGDHLAVSGDNGALENLAPALDKMGLVLAEVAEGVQRQTAGIAAGAAAQILTPPQHPPWHRSRPATGLPQRQPTRRRLQARPRERAAQEERKCG